VDEARRLIDEDIQDLVECIRARKSRRNTYASISKLPEELLCAIFSFYQHLCLLPSNPPNLQWIIVSHVSKTWRETALNYANLWTNIPWYFPEWIPEMVKRSKDANLTIRINLDSMPGKHVALHTMCEIIHANPHRIREVTLDNFTMDDIQDAFKHLPHSSVFPLQSLTITPLNFHLFENVGDSITFIEKYLGDTSDLRRVDLFRTLAWDSRILTGLTHLTIRNELMVQQPSSTQFFDAIRRMPRLEDLRLYGVVLPAFIEESIATPDDIIELPLIRNLVLSGTAPEAANILCHLRIPPYCNIDIECTPSESSPSDSASLISSLRILYSVPPLSDTLALSVGFLELELRHDEVEFRASRRSQVASSGFLSSDYSPFLAFTLSWRAVITLITPSLTENIRRTIIDVFKALPCQNLSTLTLGFDGPAALLDDHTFLDALGSQPNMNDIQVETGFIKLFLDYMAARTNASNIPFSALRTLYLYGIDHQQGRHQPFPMPELLRFVRQRKKRGVGLSDLTIEKCYRPTADDMKLLRDSVERIFYNNRVRRQYLLYRERLE